VSVYIGHHAFAGPFRSLEQVVDKAGVYALVTPAARGFRVLEVNQSANLRSALALSLAGQAGDEAQMAVLYTPGVQRTGRLRLVDKIRKECE
jgi:hypothetical protein